ncbi:hypothetical protein FACS189449_08130 [Alphaproteobacteria bacterium]|nr:hypothetical protein FACS189449_08130 [Alphaproteobacteria bacterium]
MASGDKKSNCRCDRQEREGERERKEAFDWICQGGRYFERACDCANVTPNAVRMELLKKRICKANRNT